MAQVTRFRGWRALVVGGESDHPQPVAPSPGGTVELIEVETSFGTVAAGEQALIDAIRELLKAEAKPDEDEIVL